MNADQAKKLGAASGIENVETVLSEQGREAVIATLKPGHDAWDEAAAAAGAHRFDRVPDDLASVYYEAYAAAAQKRAEQIAAED